MVEKLRHGLSYLWPSEIADQFYCEYKVHLKRLHPEVRVNLVRLESGGEDHAVLANQAEPASKQEIERRIQTGKKLAICESELEGSFQGVLIRGRPDLFAVEGKKGLLLLDFKFSGAKNPYRDHEVQAEVYGLLAESMGFSVEEMFLGIVIFSTVGNLADKITQDDVPCGASFPSGALDNTLRDIHTKCMQKRMSLLKGRARQAIVESDNWKAFLFRYDRAKATKNLTWALRYWLAEREPEPEKRNPRKCVACPLNAAGLCEHALDKADTGFVVVRSSDGQVVVSRDHPTKRPE